MKVMASNKNLPHSANASVDINLLEGVDIAIIQGPLFVPSGEVIVFTLANHTGSNLSYFWNITDGTPDSFHPNLTHSFTNPGTYDISVVIFNIVSDKSNTTTVIVQNKIIGLTMTVQDSAVNTAVPFTLSLSAGTNYTCQLDYNDGTPVLITDNTSMPVGAPLRVTHTYSSTGVYSVIILCENQVSKENATFDLYIQEPITNLELVREGAPTNEQFAIGWTVDSGTEINFTVTFIGQPLSLNPAKTSTYSWESLTLPGKSAAGYPLQITANNRISSANITTTFIIMDKIVNPSLTVDLTNVTTDDLVTFSVNVQKGSDVSVVIQFQDGSPNYSWYTDPPGATWPGPLNLTHYFINGCVCNVKAIISNKAGSFERYVDVLVKVGFSTISWSLPDEAFYLYNPPAYVEFMFTSTTNSTPTNPTVTVDWGDGLQPKTENFVRFGSPGYSHQFDDTLDYIITVTMSNVLGSRTFKHKAIVVEKLVEPLIDLEFPSAPLGEPFNLTFKLFRGDQDNYTTLHWDLGDGSAVRITDRHGEGKYAGDNETVTYTTKRIVTVNVTATAPLNQTVSASRSFDVIDPVLDSYVTVTATPSVPLGSK
ncbi:unnamed protein product [Lymnaea stagnalis]|uniref:PKD domain-containing protein n=1 Tax=Lymnaea stagnalis TaxID=6523 RepID=A0AAV2IFL4_LYMST